MLPALSFNARISKNNHGEMVWSITDTDRLLCIVDSDWDGTQKCFRGKIRTRRDAKGKK